jgi:hypothetical protein
MYTVRIIEPVSPGRFVRVNIETYADVAVALRVAVVRARAPGVLALVLRANGDVVARFGLGSDAVAA